MIKELMKRFNGHQMSPQEKRAQAIDWATGQVMLSNEYLDEDTVRAAAAEYYDDNYHGAKRSKWLDMTGQYPIDQGYIRNVLYQHHREIGVLQDEVAELRVLVLRLQLDKE